MNHTVLAGDPYSPSFDLREPADAATVQWTLRDNTGAAMTAYQGQPIINPEGARSVVVPIPGAANAKTLTTENRFLFLTWLSVGVPRHDVHVYTLIDFLPLRAGPDEVRLLASALLMAKSTPT